ncbi:Pex24p-domain-containing protein [Hortaea werneckii]|nr:Pex24p-domain-containing protein [Hortaea werneckii]
MAPPSRVKPAPEMSKDFFRNMRDLQNSMEDFSRLHDAANEYITPYTNFSDEGTSSLLFIALFGISCSAFIASGLVPWKFVALVAGWVCTLSGHPEAQRIMLSSINLSQIRQRIENLQTHLMNFVQHDVILGEPSEARQVEIFELQKFHSSSETWESWLFSPSPFDPLSPIRIAGDRAKGTQFFEDVSPPSGWVWKDKKWILDLFSREWVEQRMIYGVEIETEGERWVYDLPQEEVAQLADAQQTTTTKGKKNGKSKGGRDPPKSGWEEGGPGASVGRGEWRRRRWVRMVERRPSPDAG